MLKTKYWTVPIAAIMLGLTLLAMMSTAYAQPPPLPMTVLGYVFVQGTSGQNVSTLNLHVYAKSDASVIANTTADSNGHYTLPVNMSTDAAPFDMWVEAVNYTRLAFHLANVTQLNMTVVDTIPPSIQIISPLPLSYVKGGDATWINATATDNFAINSTTIKMTLNGTDLAPTYDSATGILSNLTSPLVEGKYNATIYVEDIAENNATKSWNFTADSTPPTISTPYQDPPGQSVDPSVTLNVTQGTIVNVSVNITDVASGVKQAILSYNNGSGWVNQTMSPTGNLYTATILGQPAGTAVTYYITAIDNVLNTARTPIDQLYYPYSVIPEFNFAAILLILTIGTTLATVTSRTTKRKGLQSK